MSIAGVVTRGYGSFGSIAAVVTRGYISQVVAASSAASPLGPTAGYRKRRRRDYRRLLSKPELAVEPQQQPAEKKKRRKRQEYEIDPGYVPRRVEPPAPAGPLVISSPPAELGIGPRWPRELSEARRTAIIEAAESNEARRIALLKAWADALDEEEALIVLLM